MGEATKKYLLERDVRNAIDLMRNLGYSDEDILKKVTEQYDVDESYVTGEMSTGMMPEWQNKRATCVTL